jgi:UDP-N-acetylmuramate--alanine ligase
VDPVFVQKAQDLPHALATVLKDGDLLLTLGAGDIGAVSTELPTWLNQTLRGAELE